MPLKRCCIIMCKSCSARNEDKGVTYHKFPKDAKLCDKWTAAVHYPTSKLVAPSFVCSRHFCKGDFKKNKDSKYVLKSDAVPSIFQWEVSTTNMEVLQAAGNEVESTKQPDQTNEEENIANISGSSKNSEVENVDNIKKFIEAQEKDLQELKLDQNDTVQNSDQNVTVEGNAENPAEYVEKPVESVEFLHTKDIDDETMAVATSVMEKILRETEANSLKYKADKEIPKQTCNPGNSSMPLSVGSKVEAKDFSEEWYPAEIAEVDYDEMEVLVHYENSLKKSDEWINVSSPRLRPFTGASAPKPEENQPELLKLLEEVKEEPKDIKTEDNSKVYVIGERCLARWRDNRRFVATIDKDLGDGKFEVIFDDGFRWSCSANRLSKLKDTRDVLTIDTTVPSTSGAPSPILQQGPSLSPVPTFHTHLFDPTRDYLGSKSERREKKRKLNIKEIFNIGQKKSKVPKVEKEKMPKEKKVVKRTVKPKAKTVEIKMEKQDNNLPDAVASIIGTVTTSKIKIEEKEDLSEKMQMDLDCMELPDKSPDSKSDLDLVDDEDKLERFDEPDHIMHEEVMDKMKEAICKLEGGLKEVVVKLEVHSPKVDKMDSPKPYLDLKPMIDSPIRVTDTFKPDIETRIPGIETKIIDTEKLKVDNESLQEITKTQQADTDNLEIDVDLEESVADVPSPSLIDTSEAGFERIVPRDDDDDLTKSDIDMGNESPRLDIDSQPILVDIDAPLDEDIPESPVPQKTKVVKKSKKQNSEKPRKKIKKAQKKKLLQQKLVEMNEVKSKLAMMQIRMKLIEAEIQRDKQATEGVALPESALLPSEWACKWVNGQPVGKVSEVEADAKLDPSGKPALPRRSVEVVDKRLPPGWTKHMVRRSVGHSAGKWDVVLVSPANRRFHTKTDMRNFLETADESEKAYEFALMDFGVHLKLARKLGWISSTPDGVAEAPETILAADSKSCLSPLVKRKTLSLKRKAVGVKLKDKNKKRPIKLKLQRRMHTYDSQLIDAEGETSAMSAEQTQPLLPALEDGFVWVGSLKVQVIDNLLRCPAEGCVKNFRNNTLLQMHIKHYHMELCKMMGATPKVLDLAAARTKPTAAELARHDQKTIKVKINRLPKREEPKYEPIYKQENEAEIDNTQISPNKDVIIPKIPRSQDSPKLRNALVNKPVKRPRVLLPMRRLEPEAISECLDEEVCVDIEPSVDGPPTDVLDFETAISTHTVTKPLDKKKKGDKKQKSFASFAKNISEDEELFAMNSDDVDTQSSFPRSGTPDDSKIIDPKTGLLSSSDPMEDQMDPSLYTFTETGERIKIVHMKREEIINCHCGIREEDGLMVQCELCLCWQHALCHNIQKESEVPEKYTCSICLNPRRGRRSKRFVHDQDRLYEGLLPGAAPDRSLRRAHELAGNLLRIRDALHALKVKCYVSTKKDHPKLYLWAKDWEQTEVTYKPNSDYSDLSIMINGISKENPAKTDDAQLMEMRPACEDAESDRYSQREGQLGSQALLSGLLSSPSAASIELPISTSELERLARSVQEAECLAMPQEAPAPQPEAPIENDKCRERLLTHIQSCQALIDSRLDSIEAQVAELESQDPSFGENYETAENCPRIKQTVQMLLRDLDTMEELGVIT